MIEKSFVVIKRSKWDYNLVELERGYNTINNRVIFDQKIIFKEPVYKFTINPKRKIPKVKMIKTSVNELLFGRYYSVKGLYPNEEKAVEDVYKYFSISLWERNTKQTKLDDYRFLKMFRHH